MAATKDARTCSSSSDDDSPPSTDLLPPSPPLPPTEETALLMHREREDGALQVTAAEQGVRDMEAIRRVWTSPKVVAALYLCILLVIFGTGLESQASSNLLPYATSEFSEHALVSTVGISSSFIAGVARIPTAKLVDLWGRGEGFVLMSALATLGLALMALCSNVTVYVIAQVFYAVGTDSANYILYVIMADVSSLRNRALAFGFSTTPYLLTAFAGPAIAQWFQENSTWRWAYATFAITTPLLSAPLALILFASKRKAYNEGLIRPSHLQKDVSTKLRLRRLAVEFDAVGATLFTTGLALVLIPLSLQSRHNHHDAGSSDDDRSSSSSATLLFSRSLLTKSLAGHFCLLLFAAWETRYASVPLIPYRVVANRTVAASCVLCFACLVATGAYHTYLASFLQVVHRLPIRAAGYVANMASITTCLCGVSVAWLIRTTRRFKVWGVLAQPVRAAGLLGLVPVVARGDGAQTRALVAAQFAVAVAGSMLVAANNTAVNAAVARDDVAVTIAVMLLCSSVGNSVGTAVAGVVWAADMPRLLHEYLPAGKKHLALEIYGSLRKQLEFADGSPERAAIVKAYSVTETRLCWYAALSVPVVCACVLVWRNLPVGDEMQVDSGDDEHVD